MTRSSDTLAGRCTCGNVQYELTAPPMFVHCCHCTWCQRETGSAFALNALIETANVALRAGEIEQTQLPSNSGHGQVTCRCPSCKVVLWSHYGDAPSPISFVRIGTLNDPSACPPDIHIYTSTKLSWVKLNDDIPIVAEYYRRSEHWPAESVTRFKKALGKE